jgi:hypothetical protein
MVDNVYMDDYINILYARAVGVTVALERALRRGVYVPELVAEALNLSTLLRAGAGDLRIKTDGYKSNKNLLKK